jgi:GTPase involved in cell partitioning and DNA repair
MIYHEHEAIIADIPGIIEGHQKAPDGDQILKHIA